MSSFEKATKRLTKDSVLENNAYQTLLLEPDKHKNVYIHLYNIIFLRLAIWKWVVGYDWHEDVCWINLPAGAVVLSAVTVADFFWVLFADFPRLFLSPSVKSITKKWTACLAAVDKWNKWNKYNHSAEPTCPMMWECGLNGLCILPDIDWTAEPSLLRIHRTDPQLKLEAFAD